MVWFSLNSFHEEAIAVGSYFSNLDKIGQTEYYVYNFYMGYSHYSILSKESAVKYLTLVNESHIDSQCPRRFKISEYMLDEMKEWKPGLDDIKREMNISAQRMDAGKGGKKTQEVQKRIIAKLDQEIKDIEDAEAKAKSDAEAKYSRDSDKSNPNPPKPSDESKIMQGPPGSGGIDQKKLKGYAENWGNMAPLERQKAVQDITKSLPPKHRQLVEDYYRALNRSK